MDPKIIRYYQLNAALRPRHAPIDVRLLSADEKKKFYIVRKDTDGTKLIPREGVIGGADVDIITNGITIIGRGC